MPGQKRRKHKKRKKRSNSPNQTARELNQGTSSEKLRKRTKAIDKRFLHSTPEVYARPTSGGQDHSPPKVTDDGVQKYEKTLVSRLAIETLIKEGKLTPTAQPVLLRGSRAVNEAVGSHGINEGIGLWLWRDSRESLRRLLTSSREVPPEAVALTKGTWILEMRLPRGLDRKREKYVNAARAMTELDRKGYYDFRIEAKGGSQKARPPGVVRALRPPEPLDQFSICH
jgi:hypothetical protein